MRWFGPSALDISESKTWGDAPGWYGVAPLALKTIFTDEQQSCRYWLPGPPNRFCNRYLAVSLKVAFWPVLEMPAALPSALIFFVTVAAVLPSFWATAL